MYKIVVFSELTIVVKPLAFGRLDEGTKNSYVDPDCITNEIKTCVSQLLHGSSLVFYLDPHTYIPPVASQSSAAHLNLIY